MELPYVCEAGSCRPTESAIAGARLPRVECHGEPGGHQICVQTMGLDSTSRQRWRNASFLCEKRVLERAHVNCVASTSYDACGCCARRRVIPIALRTCAFAQASRSPRDFVCARSAVVNATAFFPCICASTWVGKNVWLHRKGSLMFVFPLCLDQCPNKSCIRAMSVVSFASSKLCTVVL